MSPTRTRGRRAPDARKKLATYRAKRDFKVTAEPAGGDAPPPSGNRFVVQRHRATRLHYDLRLEMNGVLVSWAVPKGPTLDPNAKRMAVHVEDHPLEYFDFEGVIPKGEYGGGDVIVWDWGTWTPAKDKDEPGQRVRDGELHFDLEGEKLRGRFALVRRGTSGAKEQWLLFHKRDEHAVEGWDAEDHLVSVKSRRTNDEVAAKPKASWSSRKPTVAKWARFDAWKPPTGSELSALEAIKREGFWTLGGEEIRVTNLDKELFPKRGRGKPVTKRDLILYHACIAPAHAPVPRRPRREPAPVPVRIGETRLLAQGSTRSRGRLRAPVAVRGRRERRDPGLFGDRQPCGARLDGQLRRARAEPVDLARPTSPMSPPGH